MTPITLAALLAAATPVAAGGRVLLAGPVLVVTSADPTIFPQSWRGEPILASGAALPEAHFARAREVFGRALRKYPPAVLRAHLEAVYVLSELRYSAVMTSGTNSRTSVYVKMVEGKGFTDAHVEGVFHAEFSSILLRNRARDFDAAAWEAVNPPGFRYLGNGVDAVKQNKAGLAPRAELHEQGFQNQYAQSNLENDLNGFAGLIFSGDAARWATADRHPKLRRKLELTLGFYGKLDPGFTEAYFRGLAK